MIHSEKLEETALWKAYQKKDIYYNKQSSWGKKVYKVSVEYIKDVRLTF